MTEEYQVAIVSFEGAISRKVRAVRKKLRTLEAKSEFRIVVFCSGRLHDGDVKVTYEVAFDTLYGSAVKGNDLDNAIEELMRREGWQERNQPKMLTTSRIDSEDGDGPEGDSF
jgi:hypothetical protein